LYITDDVIDDTTTTTATTITITTTTTTPSNNNNNNNNNNKLKQRFVYSVTVTIKISLSENFFSQKINLEVFVSNYNVKISFYCTYYGNGFILLSLTVLSHDLVVLEYPQKKYDLKKDICFKLYPSSPSLTEAMHCSFEQSTARF
jgi:hypothetical protein